MTQTFLVTGAAGFIGSHSVEGLLGRGLQVVGVDNLRTGHLENLAAARQLGIFKHHGFWRPMDTLRDKIELENLWESGKAPWKCW